MGHHQRLPRHHIRAAANTNQVCCQLSSSRLGPETQKNQWKVLFLIHFSSSIFPQLFLTRFRVVLYFVFKKYIQVLKCVTQKIVVLGSSATFFFSFLDSIGELFQFEQAACMATNRAKIFSRSSTLGFNTVLKRF